VKRFPRLYKIIKKIISYFILFVFIVILLPALIVNLITKPSNNRNWNEDQKILPYVDIDDDSILIHNIRNTSYTSTTDYEVKYYDKEFDLNKIKRVWYIVEPFSGIPGSAHTFLSFEFENNNYISISVEIRKEKGESYHPVKGLFNQYELMYVIADERDVVKLRSNYRKDLVYVYPIKTGKEKVKGLFLDMIKRANKLKDSPEFYNTITNTCTTNIIKHVNTITPHRISILNFEVFFPEDSDELAYKLGLIDTDLSFDEARKRYFINNKAEKYADYLDFSVRIRGEK